MDSYEASRAVFSRIQSIDPDNASKIIAYILLQDQAEKEMIRLAFGPENLIRSVVNVAKSELGLSSNISSALNSSPSPPLFSPVSNPISISRPNNPRPLSLPSPRLAHTGFNASSPSSPSIWSFSSPDSNHSPSYAAVVNGSLPSPLSSSSQSALNRANFVDDYQFQEQNLSFLNDQSFELASSPGCRSDPLVYPYWEDEGQFHRACKFVHGGGGFGDSGENSSAVVGSPCMFDGLEQCQQELMRSKAAQQQRLAAAQYMAGLNFPYNKLNLLQSEAQRSAAAALMMGEEYHKLNRCQFGRNDFSGLGCGDSNPGSRQIYLTFPADSTFKEEDVSNYFSIFGPVQDVRIPYQQKRMFGFVTFVYPETVRIILAKGNPHFVCDSRVLVKPYKEKGKLLDKKQQQHQLDQSEFSSSGSPSGLDCRDPFEMHVGPRRFHSNQEMMLRKRLEQEADWQEALELQSRRLMNLQLLDLKNHNRYQQSVPVRSPHSLNQNIPPGGMPHVASEDNKLGSPNGSPTGQLEEDLNAISGGINGIINEHHPKHEGSDLRESMEHILPESLFASPTKFAAEERSAFASKPAVVDNAVTASTSTAHNDSITPPTSTLNILSFKSCFLEIPRISSGHGAIGM